MLYTCSLPVYVGLRHLQRPVHGLVREVDEERLADVMLGDHLLDVLREDEGRVRSVGSVVHLGGEVHATDGVKGQSNDNIKNSAFLHRRGSVCDRC